MKYTSIPHTVNAIQWLTSNIKDFNEFIDNCNVKNSIQIESDTAWQVGMRPPVANFIIKINDEKTTLELKHGDYLVKDNTNSLTVYKKEQFEKIYTLKTCKENNNDAGTYSRP